MGSSQDERGHGAARDFIGLPTQEMSGHRAPTGQADVLPDPTALRDAESGASPISMCRKRSFATLS